MALTHTAPPPVPASQDDQHKLWKRIADLRIAMLTTNDRDGTLSARPVSTMQVEADGTSFFLMAAAAITKQPPRETGTHKPFGT